VRIAVVRLGPLILKSNQFTRIHEFNVSSILSLFLPYYESPHFAKMLSILHISYAHFSGS
jgi:hypothetical protein